MPILNRRTIATGDASGVSVLQAVRAATRSAHLHVEASASMQRLMSDNYTAGEYSVHLRRLLGFYEPLEAALARMGDGFMPSLSPSRTRLLRHDLERLGMTTATIDVLPRCPIAAVDDSALPGIAYVYEGAALGGQLIARHLAATLDVQQGLRFYHTDAASTARRWQHFCAVLDSCSVESLDGICASAAALFTSFHAWIESDGDEETQVQAYVVHDR